MTDESESTDLDYLFKGVVKEVLGADEKRAFGNFKDLIRAQRRIPISETITKALDLHVGHQLVDIEIDPAYIHFVLDAIVGVHADAILVQPRLVSKKNNPHLQNTWLICAAATLYTTKTTGPLPRAINLIAKHNTAPKPTAVPSVPVLWMENVPSLTGDADETGFIVSTNATHKTAESKLSDLEDFSRLLDEESLKTKVSEIFGHNQEKARPEWLTDDYKRVVGSFDVIAGNFLEEVKANLDTPSESFTQTISALTAALKLTDNDVEKFDAAVRFVSGLSTNLPTPSDISKFVQDYTSPDGLDEKLSSVAKSWAQLASASIGNEATVRRALTRIIPTDVKLGKLALSLSRLVEEGLSKITPDYKFEVGPDREVDAKCVNEFLVVQSELAGGEMMAYWFPNSELGGNDDDLLEVDNILIDT